MGAKRHLATALVGPARSYVRYAPGHVGKTSLARYLIEPALRSRPHQFVATTVDGARLRGSTQDMIQRYVYVFGVWEPELTAWMRDRLEPGRTLIDVGANVGYFSLLGARLVGSTGHVVAVEPLPATFAQLQDNLRLNEAANVRALNVAADARAGRVTLYGGDVHNSGTTSTQPGVGRRRLAEVETVRLADALTPEEVRTARIVKIDVEGAELAALEGLMPCLAAAPDDLELVVEVNPVPDAPDAMPPVATLLAHQGFHAYRLVNDYALSHYARRPAPVAPARLEGPVTERTDVVFSRFDGLVLP